MSSQGALEALPVELLTAIARLCVFDDACNLRLVSRYISAGCHAGFKRYFACKTIQVTSVQQVHELERRTQQGGVGCLLENPTIVGVVKLVPVPIISLLGVFTNLRLNSPYKRLRSIELHIQGCNQHGEPIPSESFGGVTLIWQAAAVLLRAVLSTASESALPVSKLDIFSRTTRVAWLAIKSPRCWITLDCVDLLFIFLSFL